MPITTCESFVNFINDWLVRHKHFVEQLIHASSPDNTDNVPLTWEEQRSLANQFLAHCLQYYEEKSSAVAAAGDDIFVFFSPPWLTSYEKTILWVGGFKPSLAFKLIADSVHDLTRHQQERLQKIRSETKRKESELARVFALAQESVADRSVMVAARRVGAAGTVDEEAVKAEMAEAMEAVKTEMAAALNAADKLRCSTVGDVVEVMTPPQAIRFLRAAGELHLRIRELGLQKDEKSA